jgi:hypothetical protein
MVSRHVNMKVATVANTRAPCLCRGYHLDDALGLLPINVQAGLSECFEVLRRMLPGRRLAIPAVVDAEIDVELLDLARRTNLRTELV